MTPYVLTFIIVFLSVSYFLALIRIDKINSKLHNSKKRIKTLEEEERRMCATLISMSAKLRNKCPPNNDNIQFSNNDLKTIRSLVHPDKHSNSPKSNEIFKMVNDIISSK